MSNELEEIKALLADDLYPGSKDWRDGSTCERVRWLISMVETQTKEVERLESRITYLEAYYT